MSAQLKMLPKRQKEITDRIRKVGLTPKEFLFEPISNEIFNIAYQTIPQLRMKYGKADRGKGVIYISPGPAHKTNHRVPFEDFSSLLKALDEWLLRVKENIDVGNPWEDIQGFKDEVFGDRFDSYEEILDDDSAKMLDAKLTLLLEYFETREIDVSEMKEDVAFLREEAKTASKRSLRNQFIGIICSWFFTGLIPPDVVPDALAYVKSLFASFRLIQLPY